MKRKKCCNHIFIIRPGHYRVWDCVYCGKVKRGSEDMKFSLKRWTSGSDHRHGNTHRACGAADRPGGDRWGGALVRQVRRPAEAAGQGAHRHPAGADRRLFRGAGLPEGPEGAGTMPSVEQAAPSISVSASGLITASAAQSAGYVGAGTKAQTSQLATQAAVTITPGTSAKTAVAKGR